MDTYVPSLTSRHTILRIATGDATQFIDLTERLEALVAGLGIRVGFVNVQTRHTTLAVVINEDEPLLLGDFAALLERVAPRDAGYRHDDAFERIANVVAGERINGHAHCRALVLPSSAGINIADGRLQLGRWQRVFLVELDGPRERTISILAFGESAR
jgi:secondary thiamine-phosphate synthase enzyme